MRKFGLRITYKDFASICNDFFTKRKIEGRNNNLSIYEIKIKKFALDFNIELKLNEIVEIQQKTIFAWHKYIEIDPETIPLLEVIKHKKSLALITNFDHPPNVYSVLSKYNLTKYFEFVAISGELGFEKPDPKIFHITLENVGLKPVDVVFIGDTNEDVIGAINADIKPILIQRQSLKKIIQGNDHISKKKLMEEEINTHDSNLKPFKTISRLRDLYEILRLQ
jgi:HAD superfamily hydrolase (TIGR01549 family)